MWKQLRSRVDALDFVTVLAFGLIGGGVRVLSTWAHAAIAVGGLVLSVVIVAAYARGRRAQG